MLCVYCECPSGHRVMRTMLHNSPFSWSGPASCRLLMIMANCLITLYGYLLPPLNSDYYSCFSSSFVYKLCGSLQIISGMRNIYFMLERIIHLSINYLRIVPNHHASCVSRNLVKSRGRNGLWEGGW